MILTITLNAAIDKRLVTCGARPGEVNRVKQCDYTAGGKGLNVSNVLSIAGEELLASGFVGGFAGRYIEHELNRKGIANDFYFIDRESRSCINIWDEEQKIQTEYLEPGFTLTEDEVQGFLKKYQQLLKKADAAAISGSVPGGVAPDIYKYMVLMARKENKKVILDSSGDLLKYGIEGMPDLIKPNIDEIRMLTGKTCENRETVIRAAAELQQRGIPYVVVSLGSEGAVMINKDGIYQACVPKIDAVNTVGCGDAMVAGFAAALKKSLPADEMLRRAASISTAAAMSEQTGYFEEQNRKMIYEQIEIKKM